MSREDMAADRDVAVDTLREVIRMAREGLNYALDGQGQEMVVFEWSTEKGECQDCGAPAAYQLRHVLHSGMPFLLCAVDAAYHAAHGDEIEYLFDEEELEGDRSD